jgi:hypothetical protein
MGNRILSSSKRRPCVFSGVRDRKKPWFRCNSLGQWRHGLPCRIQIKQELTSDSTITGLATGLRVRGCMTTCSVRAKYRDRGGRFYRSDALTVPLEEWLPADVSTRTLVMYRTDRSWQIFSNTDKVIRREPGTRRFRSAALAVPPPSPPARSTGRRPWRFLLRTIDITAAGRPDLCPEPAVRLAINSYRHIGFCACNVCCGYHRQSSIRRSSGP